MNTKTVSEIIGIIAIVGSLIFVGFQLQQDRAIAEAELLSADQELEIQFAQLVQGSPEAWRKGLAGEQLTPEEEVNFDLMAYSLFRLAANTTRRTLVFDGLTIGSTGEGVRGYAYFVYENPGLRAWFNKLINNRLQIDRGYGLQEELRYFPVPVQNFINQLEESNAEPTEQRYYPY